MKLEDLGYNDQLERFRQENGISRDLTGRVIAEHKERYAVVTDQGEFDAEITGNLRFTASSREDFPAVGDWVELNQVDHRFAIILRIFPRKSVMKRQAAGQVVENQVIGTNIDGAFIVQSVDRDHNLNRLQRYLTLCHAAGVKPVILVSKVDLIGKEEETIFLQRIAARTGDIPLVAFSNETAKGYAAVRSMLESGRTYCLLGSSGAGKSTLINHLSGKTVMKTGEISTHTGRGKHVTSHRQLIVLEGGGILMDTPGMREVGIGDSDPGLVTTFDDIALKAQHCRYRDCTHTTEEGCAVIEAVETRGINRESYENYLKMRKENEHFQSTVAERRRKEKDFGKMLKDYKKQMKKNRS